MRHFGPCSKAGRTDRANLSSSRSSPILLGPLSRTAVPKQHWNADEGDYYRNRASGTVVPENKSRKWLKFGPSEKLRRNISRHHTWSDMFNRWIHHSKAHLRLVITAL